MAGGNRFLAFEKPSAAPAATARPVGSPGQAGSLALLLVHNMIAAMAARAAAAAGTSIAAVSFTAVLSLVRDHVAADVCCRHCGQRPSGSGNPLGQLTTAIEA